MHLFCFKGTQYRLISLALVDWSKLDYPFKSILEIKIWTFDAILLKIGEIEVVETLLLALDFSFVVQIVKVVDTKSILDLIALNFYTTVFVSNFQNISMIDRRLRYFGIVVSSRTIHICVDK